MNVKGKRGCGRRRYGDDDRVEPNGDVRIVGVCVWMPEGQLVQDEGPYIIM